MGDNFKNFTIILSNRDYEIDLKMNPDILLCREVILISYIFPILDISISFCNMGRLLQKATTSQNADDN